MNPFPNITPIKWLTIAFYAALAWASIIVTGWFAYFCAIHLASYNLMARGIVWWVFGTGNPP